MVCCWSGKPPTLQNEATQRLSSCCRSLPSPSQRIYKYKVEGQIHELWRLGWSGGLMSTNTMCGFGYRVMAGRLAEGARCTARVTQHPQWCFHIFERGLLVAILSPKTLDLNSKTQIQYKHGIFVICRNNLNGFWDFYHSTNMSAGSPKVRVHLHP